MGTMATKPLKFDRGETLEVLAARVKTAFDRGETKVYVSFENQDLPERIMSNDIFDDGGGPVGATEAVFNAFEEAGICLPLRVSIGREPGMAENAPYSTFLVYEKPQLQPETEFTPS